MRLRDVRWMSLGTFDSCVHVYEGLTDPATQKKRTDRQSIDKIIRGTYGSGKVQNKRAQTYRMAGKERHGQAKKSHLNALLTHRSPQSYRELGGCQPEHLIQMGISLNSLSSPPWIKFSSSKLYGELSPIFHRPKEKKGKSGCGGGGG
jgi:hypothetical protein